MNLRTRELRRFFMIHRMPDHSIGSQAGKENNKKHDWITWLAGLGLWAAAAVLEYAARTVPGFAESYATHVYPCFTGTVGRAIGLLPFSVVEIALYALILAVVLRIIRAFARLIHKDERLGRIFVAFIRQTVFLTGLLAFLFVALCGINYYRDTFAARAGFVLKPSSTEELEKLCHMLVERINEDASAIARDEEGHFIEEGDLRADAAEAMNALGEVYECLRGSYPSPKPILVWPILSYQQVTGIYSPFTLEANYNRDIPRFTLPFTLCHELSHLTGFMREDEANFIGWLACARSDKAKLRYGGNLTAYITVGNALYAADREAWSRVSSALCEEAWADLSENNAYWAQFEGKPAEIHEQVNNAYLIANGQDDGVKSYGRMVDLMLAYQREGKCSSRIT